MADWINTIASNRIVIIAGFLLMGLAVGAILLGSTRTKERSTMETERRAIPPIDAAAPAETEVATFALG